MMEIRIREAKKKDLNKVIEIFVKEYAKKPYNEPWTNETANKKMQEFLKYNKFFVLDFDGKIIGFTIFHFYNWYGGIRGFIDEVVVSSEFQGKGYGKKLMNFAERYIKSKKATEISLLASPKAKAFKIYLNKRNYKDEGLVSLYKRL
jgi:ribosomal protein S18 acetylase RimI-like enzyme